MKKRIFKYIICVLLLSVSINVRANNECVCTPGDNLCEINGCYTELFYICDLSEEDGQCTVISTQSDDEYFGGINDNHDYGYFEIRDREIYLNNSTIGLSLYEPWSLLDYKIHVTGTNKIHYLESYNYIKYDHPELVAAYPELYAKDNIPITVEGDGTLEIETAAQIKKNSAGESYFNWYLKNEQEDGGHNCITDWHGLLASDCDWDKPVCSNTEFTKSEIRQKFIEDRNQLGIVDGGTYPLTDYYEAPTLDMDNPIDRETWINELLSDEPESSCDYMRLIPISPIDEGAQLTRDFGEEYIITNMNRSFTETGSYLLSPREEEPEQELETVTTTQTGGIVFVSSEPFDSNYHLGISDVTEELTEEEAKKIEAKTDKVLIKLYDINMLDKENNIVDMSNGEYTIKVALDDLLKKYKDYEVINITEDNNVELIKASVEGEYIVFNTTHLSKYGIVGTEIKTSNTVITNPKTDDKLVVYAFTFILLVSTVVYTSIRVKHIKAN